jgi:hypothetical protein
VLICGWGQVFDVAVVAGCRAETAVKLVELALWFEGRGRGRGREKKVPQR